MARELFITGFTVSEVLAIQQRAKEFLMDCKTVIRGVDSLLHLHLRPLK
jgi:hypothetical protein